MSAGQVLVAILYTVAIGLFAAVEIASRREGSRVPSLGDVCGVVMRYRVGPLPVGRIAMFSFWWWLGWHFLAR
ncbi:hypothetical protein GCM10020218_094090 [Dactylosporangium vinaceum]|uniref:Uncharacterized protein n=1 Tax=Dactylosporangium matsuzakiense TaxID=53360 RepID=A0A9W6KWH3_9ACTN|nr:hypothetical protein GCM10017581_103650 [Dactylosporangium matsuzakiense]